MRKVLFSNSFFIFHYKTRARRNIFHLIKIMKITLNKHQVGLFALGCKNINPIASSLFYFILLLHRVS